jgi:DNA-binding SARP family transcriptional activator
MPQVTLRGEPLSIPRRQVRALLYRLAAERKPLSRSYLSYLLWADCPERAARQNLSRLLVYLSQALPAGRLLQVDEVQVQLAPGLAATDVGAFEKHWEAWKMSRADAELHAAAELYRGPFLSGFYLPGNNEFNAWVEAEVEHWEQRYLKTLAILVERSSQCGELAQAIEYAQSYLAHNDLAEDIHRALIELHAARGEREAALRQYERCATILERELGVKPAPETLAAYRTALEGRAGNLAWTGGGESPGGGSDIVFPAPPVWSVLPGLQAPLIGRNDALDRLESALASAREERGGVVFVCGEAGIGKSRLVQEFTSRPRLRSRVLVGTASRECCSLPYHPLVEALRPVILTPSLLQNIPAVWLAEAARLFPELSEITELPPVLSESAARLRLFEALYRILVSLGEDGYTLIVCLDDLHWADATTLDWLAYAGRRISRQRLLLVGTYRQEDGENLRHLQVSLSRQANFQGLFLCGLTCQDVQRLLELLEPGRSFDPDHAERLCQATGGNPFFLLEILRELLESGYTPGSGAEPGYLPLPATVQATVTTRLERLRPLVRQVLEAASVLGQTFTLELVQHTSGRQETEIMDSLDELVARHFLQEVLSGYQFRHAITREAVYTSLGYWRRRKLHERAGLASEKLGSEDWPTIAWHFEQGGVPGKAAGYALRAGQAARQVFAHQQARADFDHALALLEQESSRLKDPAALEANRRMRIQALYERGWALRLLGEMEAYTRDLEEEARLCLALDEPHALAHLRFREAYNHRWFCRYPEAQAAALQGLRLSQEITDRYLEALCQRELGLAARETGDYALAQTALLQALELFEGQGEQAIYRLHTLGNLSTLSLRQGDATQAGVYAAQALELCQRLNLPYERRLPLGDLGAAAVAQGDYAGARSLLLESLEIAAQIADRTQEIFCQGHIGWALVHQADFLQACNHLMKALSLAEQISSCTEQSWLHAGLALACAGLGDANSAMAHAWQALHIAQAHGRLPDEALARSILEKSIPPQRHGEH